MFKAELQPKTFEEMQGEKLAACGSNGFIITCPIENYTRRKSGKTGSFL
jgi:hypothetical protein